MTHQDAAERISTLLQTSSYHPLRRLGVDIRNGIIVVHGSVPDFHHKQQVLSIGNFLAGNFLDETTVN